MYKRDDYTVVFEFPEPYFLFVDILAGDTLIGGGQATGMARASFMGGYAPAHYLKQFLPKYSSADEVTRKAKAANFDSWVSYFRNRTNWALNPDLPVLGPWKTVSPINTPTWAMERNPYYWAVDTAGNQLPYLDRIVMNLAENLEVLNLRAIAGEYDLQERHVSLNKLPVFIENQKKGNYSIRLDTQQAGCDAAMLVNTAYEADPEISKWLKTRDFRRALALGIDRDQINEAFWLGIGTRRLVRRRPTIRANNPGKEYRKKWGVLDLKQANALLDKLGLTKKDGEGYRLRTDGKGRLRIELMTVGGQFIPYTQVAEMIRQQWKKIGIDADVKETERSLAFTKTANAEHHDHVLERRRVGEPLPLPAPRPAGGSAECHLGMPFARWYATNGAQGKKPDNPEMLRAFELLSLGGGQEGGRTDQDRQGDLEDPRGGVLGHRHRGPLAGLHGRADHQEQHGEHPHAADQRAARPDAEHLASGDVLLQVVTHALAPPDTRPRDREGGCSLFGVPVRRVVTGQGLFAFYSQNAVDIECGRRLDSRHRFIFRP